MRKLVPSDEMIFLEIRSLDEASSSELEVREDGGGIDLIEPDASFEDRRTKASFAEETTDVGLRNNVMCRFTASFSSDCVGPMRISSEGERSARGEGGGGHAPRRYLPFASGYSGSLVRRPCYDEDRVQG